LPKQTVAQRGEKTVWVRHGGKDKERVTVMLLADSDGDKCTPFLVFKVGKSNVPGGDGNNWKERRGFGVRFWKEAERIMTNTGMELFGNPTAWWNSDVHMEFLKISFASRPRPWKPVLLLVDDFSGNWSDGIESYALSIDVHFMKVPPSCTSTAQPADISWNRPFKSYLRSAWVAELQDQPKPRRAGCIQVYSTKPIDCLRLGESELGSAVALNYPKWLQEGAHYLATSNSRGEPHYCLIQHALGSRRTNTDRRLCDPPKCESDSRCRG
jgi:hypothetical protein